MTKPIVIERYTDNGEHSHWELVNNNGEVLWQESDSVMQEGKENINVVITERQITKMNSNLNAYDLVLCEKCNNTFATVNNQPEACPDCNKPAA